MPRFSPIEQFEAPQEVASLYRDFQHKMDLPEVPNFIRTQGASSSTLAATCALVEHVLLEGRLPRSIKELIFVAIAVDRQCSYCQEAHAACCRMLGIDHDTIESVMNGLYDNIPTNTRDILLFAVKCAAVPEELDDEDFESLKRQDLDNERILEVIATAAMATYATIVADATMLEPDVMFQRM